MASVSGMLTHLYHQLTLVGSNLKDGHLVTGVSLHLLTQKELTSVEAGLWTE